jgi:hypothetical protein
MVRTTDCMMECKGEARWCIDDNKTRNNQSFKKVRLQRRWPFRRRRAGGGGAQRRATVRWRKTTIGELTAVVMKASFSGLVMEPSFAEEGNPSRPTWRGIIISKHKLLGFFCWIPTMEH